MVSGEGLWFEPELEDQIVEEMAKHRHDCVRYDRIPHRRLPLRP